MKLSQKREEAQAIADKIGAEVKANRDKDGKCKDEKLQALFDETSVRLEGLVRLIDAGFKTTDEISRIIG